MTSMVTFVADTLTPVRAYAALRRAAGDSASFLLESVVGGERWGRYSILGYRPKQEMTLQANGQWVGADGRPAALVRAAGARDPLEAAQALFQASRSREDIVHPAARFAHAYVGYLAWDLVHAIDKVPDWGKRAAAPLGRFFGGSTIVVFDGLSHTVTIVANDAAAMLLVADSNAKKGELDMALEAYQTAWGFDHSDPTPLVHASEACHAASRDTSARAFGAKAVGEFPNWAPGWAALGDALVGQGETKAARDAYRSAVGAPDGPVDRRAVAQKLAALK